MARQRRGGGFRPPELRGTLGTLLRTAAAQVGPLRDALERTAREGRSRLEDVRASRRRTDALAELGEIVLDLIRRGEIDIDELPEVRDVVAFLDELDAGHDEDHDGAFVAPPTRNRFDSRRRPTRDEDDGTVSSRSAWSPPAPRQGRTPPRVWRPPVDDEPPLAEESPPAARPKPAARKGGIIFGDDEDDDDDLADYMHPDDVPPKQPPEDS